MEYYKGNLLLPVLCNERYVPLPDEVVDLLFGVGKLVRLFLVDLNALKTQCSHVGSMKLSKTPGALDEEPMDTIVIASNSDPRKPHIVNCFANGRVECNNCPGYASLSVCAHVLRHALRRAGLKTFCTGLSVQYGQKVVPVLIYRKQSLLVCLKLEAKREKKHREGKPMARSKHH